MTISIGNNIASLRAQRQLASATDTLTRVNERLASGQRINRAADDAAGLAIADSLRADRRVFAQGIKNLNDGLSLLNIADSALGELTAVSIRHKELATQSANGILGNAQRQALDEEADALVEEFNRILETTEFNGRKILRSDFGELRLQAGYGLDGSLAVAIGEVMTTTLSDGTFSAPVTLTHGSDTKSARSGDFNADGFADVVTTGGNRVDIFLGNGDGTFLSSVSFPTDTGPRGTSVGDVNNDGRLDLATANDGAGNISILLGNGDGTLQSAVNWLALSNPNRVELADVNEDGNLDILATERTADHGVVSLGNGDGTFRAQSTFYVGFDPRDLFVSDINGDDSLDLLVANRRSNSVTFHSGNGDGTFNSAITFAAGDEPYGVVAADLDSSGTQDLIVGNFISGDITVRLGNGNGTFTAQVTYGALGGPDKLAAADINGDGLTDVVAVNRDTDNIALFFGNGDGSFRAVETVSAGDSPQNIALTDFDNNGSLDLLAASAAIQSALIFFGNTTSSEAIVGLAPLSEKNLTNRTSALNEIEVAEATLTRINSARATIGAYQSRVETAIRNLQTAGENYAGAESRIRDTDIAADVAQAARVSILQQAGANVLAQANQQPAIALQLLAP